MHEMSNEVARAFLARLMSSNDRAAVRKAEASFLPHECLQASQIVAVLREMGTIIRLELEPEEVAAMETLWNEFYKRILWKQKEIESARHPKGCTMMSCYHPWNPLDKTVSQELHQWEDYALAHYKPPQVAGRSLDKTLGVV